MLLVFLLDLSVCTVHYSIPLAVGSLFSVLLPQTSQTLSFNPLLVNLLVESSLLSLFPNPSSQLHRSAAPASARLHRSAVSSSSTLHSPLLSPPSTSAQPAVSPIDSLHRLFSFVSTSRSIHQSIARRSANRALSSSVSRCLLQRPLSATQHLPRSLLHTTSAQLASPPEYTVSPTAFFILQASSYSVYQITLFSRLFCVCRVISVVFVVLLFG